MVAEYKPGSSVLLKRNPNYWQTCEGPKNTVPEESSERYEVKVLQASTSPGGVACSAANPCSLS